MLEILIASLFSSVIILGFGYLFSNLFYSKKYVSKLFISEISIYGIIFLSFVSLILNFFFPINKIIGTIIVIISIISIIINQGYKHYIFLFVTSLITFLLIFYSNVNRPDAGLYHLPVISMINESKILIGSANIHFRFGHSSIVQYLSSIYNNYFFNLSFITFPIGSIFSFFIFYVLQKTNKSIKHNKTNAVFLFLICIFSIYSFNRYSSYGNDAVSHIFYFILVIKILTIDSIKKIKFDDFISILIITIFLFSTKLFMTLAFFIPLMLFFFIKDRMKLIFSKQFFICSIFLFSWIIKSLLISGCVFYPLEISCFKSLKYYEPNKTNIEVSAGEAWSKDWPNQQGKKLDYKEYNKKFNWLKTWTSNHLKIILEKIIPFIIFLLILFLILIKMKKDNYEDQKKVKNKRIFYILLFSIFFGIVWFIKFPLYRYGFSFLACILMCIFCLLFEKIFIRISHENLKKKFYLVITIGFLAFFSKNLVRINHKLVDNTLSPWPDIYSETGNFKQNNFTKISKDGNFLYYFASGKLCMYSKSPCSTYIIENLYIKKINGYMVYWIK